ncbi:Ethylene response sensor [Saliniradius amylolyticus]|uniref:diguanylate cyclase n=1 Tax=Saliniradius amylolyticus TaxID=2183582 RepID=A0A2S2E3Q9_9ALTE|nr:GGDEF domain-containing protein [Saliniradius amylolyticus]AWL12273.1 Ethylene response sensor [Saliniradius amylolyticus]
MEIIGRLLDGSLMPHGHCLLWRGDLLLMHVGGDLLTTLAYFTIPIALIILVRKRDDLEFDSIFLMFAAFIFLCGVTHLLSLVNVWHGYYFLEGIAKSLTGLVSVATAIMIWRLIPKALAIPSNKTLREKNHQLDAAHQELINLNASLERQVKQRTLQLEKLASTDPLTNLVNRRTIVATLESEMERAERYDVALSIIMIDMDDFKRVNDEHGHLVGDKLLQTAAKGVQQFIRKTDRVGRYGGEEFLAVVPHCDADNAARLAERIRYKMATISIPLESREALQTSCSLGVAQYQPGWDMNEFIDYADKALYKAKHSGKNQVSVYSSETKNGAE